MIQGNFRQEEFNIINIQKVLKDIKKGGCELINKNDEQIKLDEIIKSLFSVSKKVVVANSK